MMDPIFESGADWLDDLPQYQRAEFDQMLTSGYSFEAIAREWLTTPGPANTFPYGGSGFAQVFYDKFIRELHAFLCGGQAYETDRQNVLQQLGAGRIVVTGMITTALTTPLGATAALVGPAVILTLASISHIGLKAWCAAQAEIASTQAPSPDELPPAPRTGPTELPPAEPRTGNAV